MMHAWRKVIMALVIFVVCTQWTYPKRFSYRHSPEFSMNYTQFIIMKAVGFNFDYFDYNFDFQRSQWNSYSGLNNYVVKII